MTGLRAIQHNAAWALVLIDAQLRIPGTGTNEPARTFRGTVRDGVAGPLLFATRDEARRQRRHFRATFGTTKGLRAIVVPVRVTVLEFLTHEQAKKTGTQ